MDNSTKERPQPGDEWQVGEINPENIYPHRSLAPVKRVALFAEAFLPKQDGVTKTVVLVARHLQQTGREVMIFAPYMPPDGEHNGTPACFGDSQVVPVAPSFSVIHAQGTRVAALARFDPSVYEHLQDFRPDLIQLFSPVALSWAGLNYATRHRVPAVANYQTDLPGYALLYAKRFPNLVWYRALYPAAWAAMRHMHNQAHINLVPSHTTMRDLEEHGFERLRLWSRGADVGRFTPEKRTEAMRKWLLHGQPETEKSLRILYVGRLAVEKRLDLLAKVARVDGVALTVVGYGTEAEMFQEMLGPQATFVGKKYGEELAEIYASADVFAFTGTNETFGQVVREAMSAGLPVLVPNAGAVVDQVQHGYNGYICRVDADHYAATIKYLRDHPHLREQMAERARQSVEQFTWEALMELLERYYWEACLINEKLKHHGMKLQHLAQV